MDFVAQFTQNPTDREQWTMSLTGELSGKHSGALGTLVAELNRLARELYVTKVAG